MKSRALIILTLAAMAIGFCSCDSTLNIDKPEDFYKYVGGDGGQTGVDMVTDADGNVYILGSSENLADTLEAKFGVQLYVVMVSPKGEVQWEKTYGDKGEDEEPKDIEFLSDGNLVVLGNRTKDKDIVVYSINKTDGSETRDPFINKTAATADYGISITQISDGGFMISGYEDAGSYKSLLIYRFDKDFLQDPFWSTSLGSFSGANGYDVIPVKVMEFTSETFYVFGYSNSPLSSNHAGSDYNYFIQPFNNFAVASAQTFIIPEPGTGVTNERLTSVKLIPEASGIGYVLTGYSSDVSGADQNMYVVTIKPNLLISSVSSLDPNTYVTNKNLIKFDNQLGTNATVYPTANKGFLVLSNVGVVGDNNLYLTKLKEDLSFEWGKDETDPASYRLLGGIGDDAAGSVIETSDGRILVLGTIVLGDLKGQRKIAVIKLDSQGMLGQ